MTVAAHLLITGRVQGVWYRASTAQEAQTLGLAGWVRNMPDGSVEALAQGTKEQVEALIQWCWQGPELARVGAIDVEWIEADERMNRFDVRY